MCVCPFNSVVQKPGKLQHLISIHVAVLALFSLKGLAVALVSFRKLTCIAAKGFCSPGSIYSTLKLSPSSYLCVTVSSQCHFMAYG